MHPVTADKLGQLLLHEAKLSVLDPVGQMLAESIRDLGILDHAVHQRRQLPGRQFRGVGGCRRWRGCHNNRRRLTRRPQHPNQQRRAAERKAHSHQYHAGVAGYAAMPALPVARIREANPFPPAAQDILTDGLITRRILSARAIDASVGLAIVVNHPVTFPSHKTPPAPKRKRGVRIIDLLFNELDPQGPRRSPQRH